MLNDILQLTVLAERGVREAQLLLDMKRHAVKNQDEQDRRWRNMSHAVDQLKSQGKEPQTCQDYLNVFSYQGLTPLNRLSGPQRGRKMRFDQFMSACGGFSLERDYPGKSEPDAPPKCEGCRKQGAERRCSWCGEWYCCTKCFLTDRNAHRPTCTTAVDNMHCGLPPTPAPGLWPAQQYALVYSLAQPAAAASSSSSSGGSSSSTATNAAAGSGGKVRGGSSSATAAQQQQQKATAVLGGVDAASSAIAEMSLGVDVAETPHGGKTKSQKHNAKRREKHKQEKAAAAATAAAAEGGGAIKSAGLLGTTGEPAAAAAAAAAAGGCC